MIFIDDILKLSAAEKILLIEKVWDNINPNEITIPEDHISKRRGFFIKLGRSSEENLFFSMTRRQSFNLNLSTSAALSDSSHRHLLPLAFPAL